MINELDIVKVIELSSRVPEAKIGDIGTVLTFFSENKKVVGYEIECINDLGQTEWVGAFETHQIELHEKYPR